MRLATILLSTLATASHPKKNISFQKPTDRDLQIRVEGGGGYEGKDAKQAGWRSPVQGPGLENWKRGRDSLREGGHRLPKSREKEQHKT